MEWLVREVRLEVTDGTRLLHARHVCLDLAKTPPPSARHQIPSPPAVHARPLFLL